MIRIRMAGIEPEELDKEQEMMKIRRDHLKTAMVEEQKLAHLNRMKILYHWRKVLRLAKTEQLKKVIQIYQQNHDREVDAKDAILQMLDRDLDEAEEQYQMALRNHLIHIDDLIALQESRLRGLHEEFERDTRILKDEYDREKSDIERSHDMETQELNEMIATVIEEEELKQKAIRDAHLAEKEQTKNKNVEEQEAMKHELLKKIYVLDNSFESHFRSYSQETNQRTQEYEQKIVQDGITSEKIIHLSNEIQRSKDLTQFWALKTQQQQRECEERDSQLLKEKTQILKHVHDLKRKMASQRAEKEAQLGNLCTNSLKCMETLREYQTLGEKILKTSELCRKLETEKEKVLPFYQSDPDTQEEADLKVEAIQGLNKDAYNEFGMLDNFYKRFNKVHLDKLAINKQKATLEKENLFFKNLLKQYLDGVSVNDDVINNNNPLLVVNNRVNLNRPPVVMEEGAHTTVIEGNNVVTNTALQRNANYH